MMMITGEGIVTRTERDTETTTDVIETTIGETETETETTTDETETTIDETERETTTEDINVAEVTVEAEAEVEISEEGEQLTSHNDSLLLLAIKFIP